MATSFNINVHDLQYILKQIKIAEASSAAYSATPKSILQAIMDAYGVTAVNAAQLPAGLRTVDGTYNNLLSEVTKYYGAADTLFPRLTNPVFQNGLDGDAIDFNGDGIADVINTNYGDTNGAAAGGIRSVADADPRLISNLIVDMSVNNPAAIAAFLANPLSIEAFVAATGLAASQAETWLTNPDNATAANALLKTIPNQSPDIGLSPGFNSWMTFFGQFFDHGLDLVTKGTNGTVYIPLQADDPLYDKGKDGIANNIVDVYFVSDPTLNPSGPLPAVSVTPTAWQAFYAVNPAGWPVGAPPPPMTATNTGFAVKFNDDGFGADGLVGTADDRPNFMALTRATATIDANGIPQHENTTTAWIDQNQTYTSHASHQVFLREYTRVGNQTVATGHLLDGTTASGSLNGAIANWGEVKAQAISMLGLKLSDFDVHNVPLLATDQYGKFIAGANGYAKVTVNVSIVDAVTGALISNVGKTFVEGVAGGLDINNLTTANLGTFALPTLGANQAFKVATVGTNHAFLNDIAHHAAPALVDHDHNPATPKIQQVADSDPGVGDDNNPLTYDDEMLNAHFVTGDGRGNENIALTSVHSIFHSEHNRLVDQNKITALKSGDLAFLNEWLVTDVTSLPVVPPNATDAALLAIANTLVWDGERLFQAARFATEMQYQHLVFEEFARRIQPMVDPFIFNNSPNIDPSIVAEFAHTVYRFGHSMLTGTVDRLENDLTGVGAGDPDQATLLAMFLNPQAYIASGGTVEEANANLIRGLTRDVGNAIDEFIVSDVRSNLLGLPLDLAALNIARGRDTGIPSLNETRRQLFNATGLADVKPYTSWADFGLHIKNPASLFNFIAAYGTHSSITSATTLADKRAAAVALVNQAGANNNANGAVDFLYGTGAYATGLGGLNDVDLWIGGLAEAHPEFGGMLGTTFNYVFEYQMEQLQFGDRMYYLTRTQGLNILNNLEPNTFSDLVMRNTALGDKYATHLNGALFVTPDHILEMDTGIAQEDYNGNATGLDPLWAPGEAHSPLTPLKVMRTLGTDTDNTNGNVAGDGHLEGGFLRFTGGEHVVVGGTEGNDRIYTDKGIDTIWGDGGNDYINAGTESDDVFGGEGDDIIEDPFGDDVLRGNQGNDVIAEARGADLVFGDEGNDYLMLGQDAAEAFGGEGDDFILGGDGKDFLLGNEGNDWIEGGAGFDTIAGDNSELFFNSTIIGHDVMFNQGDEGDYDAESGDDIMGSGASVFRYEGMFGFDWAIGKGDSGGVDFDAAIPIFTTIANDILKDRFDQVEAFSGNQFNDTLSGDDRGHKGGGSSSPDSVPTELFAEHLLTQDGINRINGFNAWFGGFDGTDARQTLFGGASPVPGSTPVSTFRDGNILMGGDGNDFLRGRGGYDLIDGDAWLNVRIKIVHNGVTYSAESMSTDTTTMGQYAGKVFDTNPDGSPNFGSPAFGGVSLNSLLLNGTINPGQLSIVREILSDNTNVTGVGQNIDTAIFQGTLAEYDIEGRTTDGINGGGQVLTQASDLDGDGFIYVRDRDTGAVGATIIGPDGVTPVTLSSRGLLTDDRDLLKNIEQLQFADQTITIAGPNRKATGTVTIGDPTPFDGKVTPYVGQVLIPTLTGVADLDGIPIDPGTGLPIGLTYEWQTTEFGSNSGWSTIQTSQTYTVRSVDPGHVLRAVAVFKDSNGVTERIFSVETDNPTVAFSVDENSLSGKVVGLQIPFSVDYDSQSIGGQPPVDVDLATLYHAIDPLNNAGGRFKVIPNGVDFNGFPRYSLVVDNGGPVLLDYEAVQGPVDNQYQVVVNSYSNNPANGGVLVAVRQFTIFLNDVNPEIVNIAPVASGPVTLAAIAEDSGVRLITTAQLLANVVDPDGPSPLSITTLSIAAGNGTLVNNNNGTWSYTPALNDDTQVTFNFTASDGGLSVNSTATLDITPVNDTPTDIQWNAVTPGDGTPLLGDLANGLPGAGTIIANLSSTDVESTSGFVYSLAAGSSPNFTVSAAGVVTRTGSTMASNTTYTLNVNSTDPGGAIRTETFTIRTGTNSALLSNGNNTIAAANVTDHIMYGSGGDDNLTGNVGNDNLFGQAGNDNLNGGDGNDNLSGGGGNDILNGGIGNDNLDGGVSNDTINGGTGIDTINGGAGIDNLTGGADSDIFVFQFTQSTATAIDRITDFVIGSDKIDLLTGAGAAIGTPTNFTRAANSTAATLTALATSVFTDANGATVGNQALAINSAALVQVTGGIAGTYLVINDGTAGFQGGNDLLINITGFTGTLPALGALTPSSFFV